MERKAQFEEQGAHFESGHFLKLRLLTPQDEAAGAESELDEGRSSKNSATAALAGFIDGSVRLLRLVEGFAHEAE
jgi:type IV secretion system protein TrbE